jgi:hypothetical protein
MAIGLKNHIFATGITKFNREKGSVSAEEICTMYRDLGREKYCGCRGSSR